jgi:Ca2+-binding RTX toxin-like protein
MYSGIEYVSLGDGDDRFRINGRDTYPALVGGEGEDVLDLRAATEGISVTMGQPTTGWRRWLTAHDVERVLGSVFNDVILGPAEEADPDPRTFFGSLGRDVLGGGRGSDVLVGGRGADTLRGNGGADTLRGQRGSDTLYGGSGNDLLNGGLGSDECHGGPGDDLLVSC